MFRGKAISLQRSAHTQKMSETFFVCFPYKIAWNWIFLYLVWVEMARNCKETVISNVLFHFQNGLSISNLSMWYDFQLLVLCSLFRMPPPCVFSFLSISRQNRAAKGRTFHRNVRYFTILRQLWQWNRKTIPNESKRKIWRRTLFHVRFCICNANATASAMNASVMVTTPSVVLLSVESHIRWFLVMDMTCVAGSVKWRIVRTWRIHNSAQWKAVYAQNMSNFTGRNFSYSHSLSHPSALSFDYIFFWGKNIFNMA